jgi:phage tail sheath protein FI
VRIKSMIQNYLTERWKEGALMGASVKEAFFVHVGLNQTMSEQDILEGRMIIQVGMAVVRPAEFIILRFMHKMLSES